MNARYGVAWFALAIGLGCAGLGSPNLEGVWCTSKDTWNCWTFEGDQVTYVNKWDKPSDRLETAPFRVESGDVLIVDWKRGPRVWKIVEKTSSTMRIYDPNKKMTHNLVKRSVHPERQGK